MTYKISKGIKESELEGFLLNALKKYGLYNSVGVNFSVALGKHLLLVLRMGVSFV